MGLWRLDGPDSGIHLFSHRAIIIRVSERGQTVGYYTHSPTELSWPGPHRGQTVRYIHSPTELSWPGSQRERTACRSSHCITVTSLSRRVVMSCFCCRLQVALTPSVRWWVSGQPRRVILLSLYHSPEIKYNSARNVSSSAPQPVIPLYRTGEITPRYPLSNGHIPLTSSDLWVPAYCELW